MDKLVGVVAALLIGPLFAAVALAGLTAAQELPGGQASAEALADIPTELLALYVAAAEGCPGLSWAIVAAIGKVETNHGRFADAQLLPDGRVEPWIIGIALDGTRGTRAIRDTDAGRWDRDTVWDRAVGPMQFIPSRPQRSPSVTASGNTGRSTVPHLHFQIAVPGRGLVCPQPVLEAWYLGSPASPSVAPTPGCTT